jgi:hypothetical protein
MRDEAAGRLVSLGLHLEGMKNEVKSQERWTLPETNAEYYRNASQTH